jgi:ADP-ribosylglycohydrolase
MNQMRYSKILGSLVYCALGDAMGAVTENLTFDQIREMYHGGLRELAEPGRTAFAYGNKAGQITDDFSQTYLLTEEIIGNNGVIDQECVENMLIRWSGIPRYFNRFAGPTTRSAIDVLKAKKEGRDYRPEGVVDYARQATNGSAMKISPAGFFHPCDIDKAIEDAVCITQVTHDNHLSISGACAVAAAISSAFEEDATLYSVMQAGIYGAKRGEEIGKERSRIVGGPSVVTRMDYAISVALSSVTKEEKLRQIYEIVGTGLHISEAVPAAFGIMMICEGNAWDSVCEAVNVGYDTDTVAAITGSIVGALEGAEKADPSMIHIMDRENDIRIEELAKKAAECIGG